MDYKSMKIEDIIKWCQANNQTEWLKAKAQEMTDYKIHPKKEITTPEGKTKLVTDKKATPTIEKRPISFIQIKNAFVEKFMPEIAPVKKEKEPSMFDKIASL